MKHFFSIEYRDPEGDLCIEHAVMTEEDAKRLIEMFAAAGVLATVNRISGIHPSSSDVMSVNELMGRLLEGVDG